MKVVLLQDIKSLGRKGDVKNVADGYARNFLLPRNLVKLATEQVIRELEVQKAKLGAQLGRLKTELENIEKATAAEPLTFQIKVGEKGEIFSSLGSREIKEKLLEKFPKLRLAGLEVEADHIKKLGKQEIEIKAGKIAGQITLEVLPQQP